MPPLLPIEVVISRRKWLRGRGGQNGYLYDSVSKTFCVVGHALRTVGIHTNALRDKRTASRLSPDARADVVERLPFLLSLSIGRDGVIYDNSPLAREITSINDRVMSEGEESQRELELIRKFSPFITLKFVD